jgi:hypothetical protein
MSNFQIIKNISKKIKKNQKNQQKSEKKNGNWFEQKSEYFRNSPPG